MIEISVAITNNVEAFVFVAEFEIRLRGTNADVKYKNSLFILLLNLKGKARQKLIVARS